MDREITSWNMVLSKNEVDLTDFIKQDLKRIADRAEQQVKHRAIHWKHFNKLIE